MLIRAYIEFDTSNEELTSGQTQWDSKKGVMEFKEYM